MTLLCAAFTMSSLPLRRPEYCLDISRLSQKISEVWPYLFVFRLVTYQHTSRPTSFPLLTVRFSWKPSCSTRVFGQPLTSVCPCPVSDRLPRPVLWSRLPAPWSSSLPNIVRSPLLPNSAPIWMLPLSSFWAVVFVSLNCSSKANTVMCSPIQVWILP